MPPYTMLQYVTIRRIMQGSMSFCALFLKVIGANYPGEIVYSGMQRAPFRYFVV